MVKIQRSKNDTTSNGAITNYVISFVLGGIVMYLYLGFVEIDPRAQSSSVDLSSVLSKAAASGDNSGIDPTTSTTLAAAATATAGAGEVTIPTYKDGWNPIHVFYGDLSGLGADPEQEWFAQVHQDEILVDLIGTKGYFIDLAANDAVELSNTIALERKGWDGLCIEPNPIYWYGLSHRKCTVVGALIGGGEIQKVNVKFRGVFGGIVGKFPKKLADRKGEPDAPEEVRYTAPIKQLLQDFHVPKVIDYMSLDVEGAELIIMEQFPFEEYQITIMTIERPSKPLKKLLASKGYIFLKDLAWWGETLWAHESSGFTPDHPKIAKIKTEERN